MTNQTEKTTEEEIETIRRDAAREVEVARKAAEAWAERAKRRVESITGTATDPLIPGGADLAGLAARESMSVPEPPPQPGKHDVAKWLDAWLLDHGTDDARELVRERILFGLKKYGTRLQSHNGRDPLEDARQEIGDALQYVAQCHLEERDTGDLWGLLTDLDQLAHYGGEDVDVKPTRLELQARGLLEGIEVGDWVVWTGNLTHHDAEPHKVIGKSEYGIQFDTMWSGRTKYAHLATPAELLTAGIIDEIPNCSKNSSSSPVFTVGQKVRAIADVHDPISPTLKKGALHEITRVKGEIVFIDGYNEVGQGWFALRFEPVESNQPVDANGEVLEVGDLVMSNRRPDSTKIFIVENVDGATVSAHRSTGPGSNREGWELPSTEFTKLTTLTHEAYLPLARRTLDPDLKGDSPTARKARMQYLIYGAFDEWGEFSDALYMSRRFDTGEAGDVLWYLTQALDELPAADAVSFEGCKIINAVKKATVHERDEYIETVAAWMAWMMERVSLIIDQHGHDIGEIRYQNVRKLMKRFPDGFVSGGGER